MDNEWALSEMSADMRVAKRSEITITDRCELIRRLALFIAPLTLLTVPHEPLRLFQRTYSHLMPASVNVYTRHIRAFFDWAIRRKLIAENPASALIVPVVRRGQPHPTRDAELHAIFACTVGPLRTAFILAAFAGLRRGEICRLRGADLDLTSPMPTALIHGKGGRERVVPLLPPVVAAIAGTPRNGWVVNINGRPYPLDRLSADAHYHLKGLGIETTLHSLRHSFATMAARTTRDPLFVRDLLGHASVATTEIYMESTLDGAHARLAPMTETASAMLVTRPLLRLVRP